MISRNLSLFTVATLAFTLSVQYHSWGGNVADAQGQPSGSSDPQPSAGRKLFLKNCAQCHGADAAGDDGPDLHGLDLTDEQIANRIRNGKKGKMTAFGSKFQPADIDAIITYLRALK